MENKFYRVIFYDKQEGKTTKHFVFTKDINLAIKDIERETPYVNALTWIEVLEEDLPDLVVVIQK